MNFDAPSHVFLNTFLASILRVGCPLQTTGLVVARARLQGKAGCVDLQHKFNSRHFVETVAEKNSAGLPTLRSTLLSLSVCRMLLEYS